MHSKKQKQNIRKFPIEIQISLYKRNTITSRADT
jgi:hypothetical protein